MSKTLFDHLKAITRYQNPNYWNTLSEGDKKSWSNYMINRFLSMNPDWTEVVNELQPITQMLEPKEVYKLYISILPKGNTFLKYVKGDSNNDSFEDWLVELVARHFEVSEKDATDYLKILYANDQGRETIIHICQTYGVEKKKVDKLGITIE